MKSFGILALALLATVALATDVEIYIYKQTCIDVPKARTYAIEKATTEECKKINPNTVDENAKITFSDDKSKQGELFEALKKGYICYFTAAGARDENGNTKLPEARKALVDVAKEGKAELLGKAFDECVADAGLKDTDVLPKDKRMNFIGCIMGKVAAECKPAGE